MVVPFDGSSASRQGPPVPAAATPRLLARLHGPLRRAEVVHRSEHALYLDVDGWCVGVTSAGAAAVPCALHTTLPRLGRLAATERAWVGSGRCRLDDVEIRVARLVDLVVPELVDPDPGSLPVLRSAAEPAATELAAVLHRPLPKLLGIGSGLTPLADDVWCGWLATGRALGFPDEPVPDARPHTTLLSATLVDCAAHGEVLPQFGALVRTLDGGSLSAVQAAAGRLAGVGHTSGAGMLLGAALRWEAHLHAGPSETEPGRQAA